MTPQESMLALLEAAYAEGYRHGYGNGHHDATFNEPDQDPADYGDGFSEWVQGQESPGPFGPVDGGALLAPLGPSWTTDVPAAKCCLECRSILMDEDCKQPVCPYCGIA